MHASKSDGQNDSQNDGAAKAPDTTEHSGPPQPRQAHVIVAEDDGELRQLMAEALRRDGHRVSEAANGIELLQLVSSSRYANAQQVADLIVSDVRMPGATGLNVLRGLRETDWGTPVILTTAFPGQALHDEAAQLGARAVLDKPFDLRLLRRLVRELLEESQKTRVRS